jgi:hypothetical protein
MPFTIKSRKVVETPLEAEYKKHIAWHARDNDPSAPKIPPKSLRSFSLVDDVVTLSTDLADTASKKSDTAAFVPDEAASHEVKPSEPVTPAEKSFLGTFSVHV